ncbi:hypothetical protein GGI12_005108 [Dipsacomyces acuminosporus]|nr:hypothetical protein GGI12_005108 [Dipsacomyces acuminosporus]
MKFAKTIETSARELPEDWQPYIIQYKQLKKNIKGIVDELDNTFKTLNLLPPTLASDPADTGAIGSGQGDYKPLAASESDALPGSASSTSAASPALSTYVSSPGEIVYHIEKDGEGVVHPVITVKIRKPPSLQDDQVVELPNIAGLPSDTAVLLPKASAATGDGQPTSIAEATNGDQDTQQCQPKLISTVDGSVSTPNEPAPLPSNVRIETKLDGAVAETQVTVRLQADQFFFDQLIKYIDRTHAFEQQYTKQYNSNVSAMGTELTAVTSPFKHDFEIWREIFRLYMDADVWSHAEGDFRPTNTAKEGQERFAEYIRHITKLGLPNKFRDPLSAKLLMNFYKLNSELIHMKLLQEMNEEATRKIIKKHDKRTHLVAKTQFPQFVAIDATSLTKALIYTIHTNLVGIVPQLDDYLCPMCLSIVWRPLRLECSHIFCSRCVVKASRRSMFNCPVCRAKGAIYRAGVNNIDNALLNFLKLYFPKEIKEKQRDTQKEITEDETRAILAPHAGHKPCIIM